MAKTRGTYSCFADTRTFASPHARTRIYNRAYLYLQGYIAAVHTFFKRPNLRKWKVFLWEDFLERQAVRRAFEKRHLPLSDGKDHDEFKGMVNAPKIWSKETPTRPGRKNRRAQPLVENDTTQAMVGKDPVVMVYDPDTNQLVPLITIE